MNRFELSSTKLNPNFIGSWIIDPLHLCDSVVEYFEKNLNKQTKGKTDIGLNQNIKKSVDISIAPNELSLTQNKLFLQYFDFLFSCYSDYLNQWPFLKSFANKVEISTFNIQRYNPGDHFQQLHSERTSLATLHRIFAWMTYLNDVDCGGTTFFSHYDLEIKPRKGLTLIWPAEWTHAHRGNIIHSGNKYIVTGWMELGK